MAKRYYKCKETHQTVKGVNYKRCTKCKRWKEVSEFCKDRTRKDGLKIYCNVCVNAYALRHYRKNKKSVRDYLRYQERHRVIRGFKEKLCSRCKQWKYYSDFYKDNRAKDRLMSWCKECERKRTEHKRTSDKKYLLYEDCHRIVKGIRQKLCTKCRRWKSENEFYKDKLRKDGLMGRCKKCSYKTAKKSGKKRSNVKNRT